MSDALVVETSVLIDYQRERPDARGYVLPLLQRGIAVIHPVTAVEMIEGVLDRTDLRRTVGFLKSFRRLSVKSADFEDCLRLVTEHKLVQGIGWPDCLIAATCVRLGLPLVTLNDKHFRAIRGLKVVRPY